MIWQRVATFEDRPTHPLEEEPKEVERIVGEGPWLAEAIHPQVVNQHYCIGDNDVTVNDVQEFRDRLPLDAIPENSVGDDSCTVLSFDSWSTWSIFEAPEVIPRVPTRAPCPVAPGTPPTVVYLTSSDEESESEDEEFVVPLNSYYLNPPQEQPPATEPSLFQEPEEFEELYEPYRKRRRIEINKDILHFEALAAQLLFESNDRNHPGIQDCKEEIVNLQIQRRELERPVVDHYQYLL